MKGIKYILILLSLYSCHSNRLTTIEYPSNYLDLGTCLEGDSISFHLPYKNTGSHTLKIWKVTGNCGCTNPQLPELPLAPNHSDSLKVTFYSKNQHGKMTNTVLIFANTNPEITQTFFKVDVRKR